MLSWFWRSAALVLTGLLIALTAVACDDDDDAASAEEIKEVEETIARVFASTGEDADYFFAHVTDNTIETVLFSTRDECEANAAECIGEPTAVEGISGTEIDGDTATATVAAEFGAVTVGLVREDGVWKADSLEAASDDVPEGAAMVDLDLAEFAFVLDDDGIPAGGNFAFHAANIGQQTHEVIVVSVPEGQDLEEAFEAVAEEEVPPTAFKVFIRPGQEVDMAFEEPLGPGDYALVCLFPDTSDPEFAPHVEKGMLLEFTVE